MTKPNRGGEPLYVAPDTDALLHFKRPDTVDWRALAPGRSVTLIFIPNTLRELEQHKDGAKAGRRHVARDVNGWLRSIRKNGLNNSGVQVVLHPYEPTDFSGGLDPSTGDDRYVASLRHLVSDGKEVVGYTNDFLCQTKLKASGLAYIEPRDQDKRTPIRDELDERVKRLEKIVAATPVPKLDLEWALEGQTHVLRFAPLKCLLDVEDEAVQVPEFRPIRSAYSGLSEARLPKGERLLGANMEDDGISRVPIHVADQYNAARNEYLLAYGKFLEGERARLSRRSRLIKASFRLLNTGSAPASNVRLHMSCPDGVYIPESRPPEGSQQEPPTPPLFPLGSTRYRMTSVAQREFTQSYSFFPDQSPEKLRRLSSDTAEARRENLQHGDSWTTDELFLIAEEHLAGTEVVLSFSIWADQIPDPTQVDLKIEIQSR